MWNVEKCYDQCNNKILTALGLDDDIRQSNVVVSQAFVMSFLQMGVNNFKGIFGLV
jgi:hypothetical protein